MDSDSTRADVEARLHETASDMSDRLASLQEEMSNTGTSLRDWVAQNPWKSVGGMLAAGVAVGALFGGRGSRRSEQSELLDQYVQALRAEVDESIAAGETPGQALEQALRGRAPLVVYEGGESTGKAQSSGGSFLGESVGFVMRLLAREVLQDLVLSWLEDTDVEGMVDEEMFE
jgi:hypothetical protein